jgi:glucosamine--fructose-6-phosphate aminotransferase (isomerizing)
VDVEYASEYTFRPERAMKQASVLVISQSGETADTLASLRHAIANGHKTLAITNVPTSTMAREAHASFPTVAGRERAVPATKSFTGQLLNVSLLALLAGQVHGTMSASDIEARLAELHTLPSLIEKQMEAWHNATRELTGLYQDASSMLFLGRGVHYPIAREGALKLKESVYLHAEGYPSGELKHGPNALVSEGTPLVMLATVDAFDIASVARYQKVVSLMRDMRKQNATIIAVANADDDVVEELATTVIKVQPTSEALLPFSEVIPLQLFSYFMAIGRGINVDQPRNLTKAVLQD